MHIGDTNTWRRAQESSLQGHTLINTRDDMQGGVRVCKYTCSCYRTITHDTSHIHPHRLRRTTGLRFLEDRRGTFTGSDSFRGGTLEGSERRGAFEDGAHGGSEQRGETEGSEQRGASGGCALESTLGDRVLVDGEPEGSERRDTPGDSDSLVSSFSSVETSCHSSTVGTSSPDAP